MFGRIAKVEKLEDCFDGSSIFQYWFEQTWEPDTIHGLKGLGQLEYFPQFPQPFFRVITTQGLQIKGVQGQDHCRAIFPHTNKDQVKADFEAFLEHQFHSGYLAGESQVERRN